MIQVAKNKFLLAIFLSLVYWIDFLLHILIELNDAHDRTIVYPELDHSKFTKLPLLNDPNSQK